MIHLYHYIQNGSMYIYIYMYIYIHYTYIYITYMYIIHHNDNYK